VPKITIVVDESEKELWVAAAYGELISLSEWLRRAANDRAGRKVTPARSVPADVPVVVPAEKAPARAKPQSKDGLCPHRVPVGSYCKRCEEEEA
jgi:hypothetical protein